MIYKNLTLKCFCWSIIASTIIMFGWHNKWAMFFALSLFNLFFELTYKNLLDRNKTPPPQDEDLYDIYGGD